MQRLLMGRTKEQQRVGQWHYYMMLVLWLVFANFGLWAQMFKQYKFAIYLHFVSMMIVTISTFMSGFLAFIYFGIEDHIGYFHIFLGIFILFVVLIQAFIGLITWQLQKSSKIKPFHVHRISSLHKITGWIIFVLINAQILIATQKYYKKIYYTTLITSLFSYIPYIILRYRKQKIKPHIIQNNQNNKNKILPILIQSSKDLIQFKQQYFIFQDKIYDSEKVMTNHPGGYQIIKNIKTRQVDRYLYGSQPLGCHLNLQVHHHSSGSIKLAEDPIATLQNIPLFRNLNQINQVSLIKLSKPCKSSKLHSFYLQSKFRPFQYKGYTDISQLGKYYALTINNRITRLYSIVNLLNQQNIHFMSMVMSTSLQQKQFQTIQSASIMQMSEQSYIQKTQKNTIPLLIKKYQNGKLTSKLFDKNNQNELIISRPYGRGLKLNQLNPGRLVFFSGGTGLHPFCDLIDIIYKQNLINTNKNYKQEILTLSPVISNYSLLKKFQFIFYISVHDLSQVSQITKHQLNHLKKNQIVQVFMKVDENIEYSQFQFQYVNTRFQKYLAEMMIELDKISQIYVCGPPSMSYKFQNCLIKLNVNKQKYTIL